MVFELMGECAAPAPPCTSALGQEQTSTAAYLYGCFEFQSGTCWLDQRSLQTMGGGVDFIESDAPTIERVGGSIPWKELFCRNTRNINMLSGAP
jgi:hypothetical protein